MPDGLTVCPKCGLVKGGFDELPKHTADGLEIARVEQKVKVEIYGGKNQMYKRRAATER